MLLTERTGFHSHCHQLFDTMEILETRNRMVQWNPKARPNLLALNRRVTSIFLDSLKISARRHLYLARYQTPLRRSAIPIEKLLHSLHVHHSEKDDEDTIWIHPSEYADNIQALAGYMKCRTTQELQILLNSTTCRKHLEYYFTNKSSIPISESMFPYHTSCYYTSGSHLQILTSLSPDEVLSGKDLCGKLGFKAKVSNASLAHCMVKSSVVVRHLHSQAQWVTTLYSRRKTSTARTYLSSSIVRGGRQIRTSPQVLP